MHRLESAGETSDGKNIARHYVDPIDERKIQGI